MPSLYIAGHTGLVGSAFLRRFQDRPDLRVITADRSRLDLADELAVETFLKKERPDTVVVAAGRVGGISANSKQPAEFLYDNLKMEMNLIHGSWKAGVQRLLNFGSSCMYPKHAPQPMRVEHLMTGKLEPTSEPYAVAKWAGLSMCAAYNRQHGTRYITAIPSTVYGPGDNFDLADAHVLSALLRKLHEAKESGSRSVTLWGTGAARREFLYADDLAEACELLLQKYEAPEPINIGSGESRTIKELAALAAQTVGYDGAIAWDEGQPDGAPEKRLESSAMRQLGWSPRTSLREGLSRAYAWFLSHRVKESACVSS